MLPGHFAKRHSILPVAFDEDGDVLSIVVAELSDEDALAEAHRIAGVRELRVHTSSKEAIQNEVDKRYAQPASLFHRRSPYRQ